jgi:hypothetical protein
MPRVSEACPYDEATRAARCESCCAGHGALPPCVVAWLDMKATGSAVAVFARRESSRQAA